MLSTQQLQALFRKERELLQNKGNRKANFAALLKSGKYLDTSVPSFWPTAEFLFIHTTKTLIIMM